MERISTTQLTSLIEAASAVAGQPDLEAVLETTVRMARQTTGARYAALGVIGPHAALSDFVYVGVDAETAAAIGHPPVGKGVLGTLIRDPAPIRLDRICDHPDSVGFPAGHPPMDAFLGVPVRSGDMVFGNLYLTDKDGGFTEDDETVVTALAAVAGGAVSSARLKGRLTRLALVEDRERIARDLHDAVIQDLFAVGLSLQGMTSGMTDEVMREGLDDAVDRIDQAIGSLRTFIFDLKTLDSRKPDPARALRRMAERIAASSGMDITMEVADMSDVPAYLFDDNMLIVREAVSNAVRHSDASNIVIAAHREADWVEVTVRDDGTGFDPKLAKRGMGLDNMHERAARHGGHVEISSSPDVGTLVRVRFQV